MEAKEGFSLSKGGTFLFDDQGRVIRVWFSSLSGLEKIYVDGALVSSRRSASMDSRSEFSVGQDNYRVGISAANFTRGPVVCELQKNGTTIKRKRLVFTGASGKRIALSYVLSFLIFFGLGLLFVIVMGRLEWPAWSLYVYVFVTIAVAAVLSVSRYQRNRPVIVDDEV